MLCNGSAGHRLQRRRQCSRGSCGAHWSLLFCRALRFCTVILHCCYCTTLLHCCCCAVAVALLRYCRASVQFQFTPAVQCELLPSPRCNLAALRCVSGGPWLLHRRPIVPPLLQIALLCNGDDCTGDGARNICFQKPNYSAPIQLNVLEKIMLTLITIDNLETQLLTSCRSKQEHEHFNLHHHWLLFRLLLALLVPCSVLAIHQGCAPLSHCSAFVPPSCSRHLQLCTCANIRTALHFRTAHWRCRAVAAALLCCRNSAVLGHQ